MATILAVEDDEQVRTLLCRFLTSAGHECIPARNGTEAKREMQGNKFDALVIDLVLPGMSGIEVAHRGRELHPQIPILFLSGYDEEKVSECLLEFRGSGYSFLQKPCMGPVLIKAVNQILSVRQS